MKLYSETKNPHGDASHPRGPWSSFPRWAGLSLGALAALFMIVPGALIGLTGCGPGGGLSGFEAAPELSEFDEAGRYSPYYASGELNVPRYIHEALTLENGLIFVVGGSDENGLSSIDTAELYDQSTLRANETRPESITGTWFDTDFEGNPMVLNQGGRIYHTLTELPDDRIIIIGGAENLGAARPIATSEIFDPLTRTFEDLEEDMIVPRFRHAASILPNGKVMITGGQVFSAFTQEDDVDVNGGGFGQGQVVVTQQIDTFPSVKQNEVFSLATGVFENLTILDTPLNAELTTRRGRSGHKVGRFAGPDNRLNTGDDLYLVVGGFQTLSGENAPGSKVPGLSGGGGQTPLTSLEFYDPIVGVFTKVPAISILGPRISLPQVTNLGVFNEFTPDNVLGMGNVVLIANGYNDAPSGAAFCIDEDELLVATYTGFGPAQGLQIFREDSPSGGHSQQIEGGTTLAGGTQGGTAVFPASETAILGRCTVNIVPVPRRIEGDVLETAVYTLGGVTLWVDPLVGQIIYSGGSIAAGVMFDPFFSLEAALDFQLTTRDLTSGRLSGRNPTGTVGCWLLMDGDVPTTDLTLFATSPQFNWASVAINHYWANTLTVAGPDGVDETSDDRLVVTGGGTGVFAPGGDPSSPSTELFIQPGQGVEPQ